MTLNTEKLTSFAQAVGSDIAERKLKPHLQAKLTSQNLDKLESHNSN